jgi:hypothetical protein
MDKPPTQGNFCDKHVKVQKPVTVEEYNWHMSYTDKKERIAKSYSINQKTSVWIKKLSFY